MATQETIKQMFSGGTLRDVEDVTARQSIAQLQSALDAMTDEDTTTAIETFQEVIDFLSGVTDDETLIGKLNELRSLINAKYTKPSGGIPASDLASGVIPDVSGKADKSEMSVGAENNGKRTVTLKQGASVDVVTLVKTVNNESILGSGNITIPAGQDGQDGADGITPHVDPTTKNWFIGTTNTGVRAEGNDGVQSGDDVFVVNNLLGIPTNLEQGQVAVLGADVGKTLGIRTRVVLDEINSDYDTDENMPTVADVGGGLTVHHAVGTNDYIYHYYVENNSVKVIASVPDPDLIYCIAESNIAVRWDIEDGWQQVGGSGGGVSVQHESGKCRIIFGGGGGGGADLNLPTISAVWADNSDFDESNDEKTLNITWKHLQAGIDITVTGSTHFTSKNNGKITTDAASGSGTLTIASTADDDATETIHVVCGDLSVDVTCKYVSVYAVKKTESPMMEVLCSILHSSGYIDSNNTTKTTASADGVTSEELADIVKLPSDFAKVADDDSNRETTPTGKLDLSKFTSLTEIGQSAFRNRRITELVLPSQSFTLAQSAFNQTALSTKTISSVNLGGCTSLGTYVFFRTEELKSIILPASVTSIGDSCFAYSGLTSITSMRLTPPTITSGSFTGVTTATVYVPDATAQAAYRADSKWGAFTNIEVISNNE